MTHVNQLITEHLDIWSMATEKKSGTGRGNGGAVSLYGIRTLRRLILELAVRGKLVGQDPNEDSVEQLLDKENQYIDRGTKPFEVPSNWVWAPLGAICRMVYGKNLPTKELLDEGFPVFGANGIIGSYHRYLYDEPMVLISCRGAYSGKANISPPNCYVTNNSLVLEQFLQPTFIEEYLFFALEGLPKKGLVTGSAQPQVTIANANPFFVPLPPLAEQHRIAAKVKKLMALCDALEQQTEDSLKAHQTLVETCLATLTNSQSADELAQNWTRIEAHFDTLFSSEDGMEALRQAIMELATSGRLVPQIPSEGDARSFLDLVASKRADLVKSGLFKKPRSNQDINVGHQSGGLPEGWIWVPISNLAAVGTGATPSRTRTEYYRPAEISWVTSGETSQEYISETNEKISELAVKETNVSIYPPGTLIIAMYGQGKTRGQISELKIEAGTNQACAALRLVIDDDWHKKYIKLFFQKAYHELRAQAAGGAQPNLNVGKISATLIPLPPPQEQKRIVDRYEALTNLLDRIAKQIQSSRSIQLNLADTLSSKAH